MSETAQNSSLLKMNKHCGVSASSTVTEKTRERSVPKQINYINRKAKEADVTEVDALFAYRENRGEHSAKLA